MQPNSQFRTGERNIEDLQSWGGEMYEEVVPGGGAMFQGARRSTRAREDARESLGTIGSSSRVGMAVLPAPLA